MNGDLFNSDSCSAEVLCVAFLILIATKILVNHTYINLLCLQVCLSKIVKNSVKHAKNIVLFVITSFA